MKSINSLSKDAQELIFELSDGDDNVFRTAQGYIDYLNGNYVFEYYGWGSESSVAKEVRDFFNNLAQFTSEVANTEVELDGRKSTFKNAAEECRIQDWEDVICATAINGMNVGCAVDDVAKQIMEDYSDCHIPSFVRI